MLVIGLGGGVPTEGAAEAAGAEGEDVALFLEAVATGGVELELPGSGVVVAIGADGFGDVVVVELADAGGEVSVHAEGVGEALVVGDGLAEDEGIGEDAGAARVEAGEHGIPAGAAEGELAVGALKADAARGELVDVGRGDLGMAVATEGVVQVVRDDEEDVGSVGG